MSVVERYLTGVDRPPETFVHDGFHRGASDLHSVQRSPLLGDTTRGTHSLGDTKLVGDDDTRNVPTRTQLPARVTIVVHCDDVRYVVGPPPSSSGRSEFVRLVVCAPEGRVYAESSFRDTGTSLALLTGGVEPSTRGLDSELARATFEERPTWGPTG